LVEIAALKPILLKILRKVEVKLLFLRSRIRRLCSVSGQQAADHRLDLHAAILPDDLPSAERNGQALRNAPPRRNIL
jgi:hypothetical protein